MAIDPVSAARAYQQAAQAMQGGGAAAAAKASTLATLCRKRSGRPAQARALPNNKALAVAGGQGDIVDVVTAIAAAETQLQTVIAVRDQVISAYQEILRMPI